MVRRMFVDTHAHFDAELTDDDIRGLLDRARAAAVSRIVAIGGTGQYLPIFGDDALPLSCEIFLPPDAGIATP